LNSSLEKLQNVSSSTQNDQWKSYIKIEEFPTWMPSGIGYERIWYNVVSLDNKIIFGTFDSYDYAVHVARNRFKDTNEWKDEQFEKIVLGNQETVVES
jgi:hypothetical protein